MKKLLLLLFVLSFGISYAQNYQCLQYGPKNYFTNGNGYLRGIRIDSVVTNGTDTIYYPFRTPRVAGYVYFCGISPTNDPNSGCWLGKNVIQQTDGTWLFDNMWHDTTVIKTKANLGDSWIFYNDATNVHYTATMTSLDTMTILGVVDSVKTFTITVDSSGLPKLNDPVNNFQLKLSKDHGFAQVFDLYTFPYHMPDSLSNITYTDYYLDLVTGRHMGRGEGDNMIFRGPYPDTVTAIFKIIDFHNPTKKEIYDFATGDIYETLYIEDRQTTYTYIHKEFIDTVISANHLPNESDYNISEHESDETYVYSAPPIPEYWSYHQLGSQIYDTTLLINTDLMPEERGNYRFYNYLPNEGPDTSFCDIRGRYVINYNSMYSDDTSARVILSHGPDANIVERAIQSYTYYPGYGLWSMSFYDANSTIDQHITYFYKNGTICYGAFKWLNNIKNINQAAITASLFPNPANDLLTVKTNITNSNYTISVTNILGQTICSLNTNNSEEKINTSNIPSGIYNVIISGNEIGKITRKLVITH